MQASVDRDVSALWRRPGRGWAPALCPDVASDREHAALVDAYAPYGGLADGDAVALKMRPLHRQPLLGGCVPAAAVDADLEAVVEAARLDRFLARW